jgi:hypothetical protein
LLLQQLGSLHDSLRPIFQWSSSPQAVSYTIVISTYSNFSLPLVNLTVNSTEYLPTTNLPPAP